MPDYTEPTADVPDYTEPTADVPDYTEPTVDIPDYTEPNADVPDYTEPTANIPDYSEPANETPDFNEPTAEPPHDEASESETTVQEQVDQESHSDATEPSWEETGTQKDETENAKAEALAEEPVSDPSAEPVDHGDDQQASQPKSDEAEANQEKTDLDQESKNQAVDEQAPPTSILTEDAKEKEETPADSEKEEEAKEEKSEDDRKEKAQKEIKADADVSEAAPASTAEADAPDISSKEETAPAVQPETPFDVTIFAASQPAYTETVTSAVQPEAEEEEAKDTSVKAQTGTENIAEADQAAPADEPSDKEAASILTKTAAMEEKTTEDAQETTAVGESEDKEEDAKDSDASDKGENNRISALQQLINQKLSEIDPLDKEATIVLAKNSLYDGDVTIDKENAENIGSDFVLKLVAADAVTEEGKTYDASQSSTTTIDGNLKISGMKVLLQGVAMALSKTISLNQADLDYKGSKATDNLEVQVGDGSSASISTYGGDDTITIVMDNGAVNTIVNTGDGKNNVNITAYEGSVEVEGGKDDDTLALQTFYGAGSVKADLGDGDDLVTAALASADSILLATGAGEDQADLDLMYGVDDVTVEAGEGDDLITVRKSDSAVIGNPSAVVTVDFGNGSDRLDVDLSVAGSVAQVEAKNQDETGDRIHVTGSLDKEVSDTARIEQDAAGSLSFKADGGKTLKVKTDSSAHITDALENKREVTVNKDTVFESFTNYILDKDAYSVEDDTKIIDGYTLADPSVSGLVLTNLVVDAGKVRIGKMDVKDFNLLVKGKEITFTDRVDAKAIMANARSTASGKEILQFSDRASVTLEKNAALYAREDIDLTAQIEQSGPNSLLFKIMEPANIRVGNAEVSAKAGSKVYAGYDFITQKDAADGYGSVAMKANVLSKGSTGSGGTPVGVNVNIQNAAVTVEKDAEITAARDITLSSESKIIIDAVTKSGLAGAPFATSVNVLNNSVSTVADGTLKAGNAVTLSAKGTMEGTAKASRGGQKSMSGIYIGVQVALQDVRAKIGSTADITAGSEVSVLSDSEEKIVTSVSAGSPSQPKSEDKSASKGDNDDDDDGSDDIKKSGLSILGNIWSASKDKIKSLWHKAKGDEKEVEANKSFEKLDKLVKSVAGSDYAVQLADESQTNGEVQITTESFSKDGGGGNQVNVKVEPESGYKVKKVWYRYLDNKDNKNLGSYVIGEASYNENTGTYHFLQKNRDMYVYVEYEPDAEQTADKSNTPSSVFDDDGNEFLIDDIPGSINDITDGMDEEEEGSSKKNQETDDDLNLGDLFENRFRFAIEPSESKDGKGNPLGAILTEKFEVVTENGKSIGKSVTQAAPSMKIAFVPNAMEGYDLADGGLTVSYFVYEKGEKKEVFDVLEKDSKGRYIFTVPDNIEAEGYGTDDDHNPIGFKVHSTFKAKDAEKEENEPDKTKTQVEGSIAVAVALNDNAALIEDGSKVKAGDNLNVKANEATSVDTSADGTAVAKPGAAKEEEKEEENKDEEPAQKMLNDLYIVPAYEYAVMVEKVKGGTVEVDKTSAHSYTFTPKQNGEAAANGATGYITYFSEGKMVNEEIKADSDGKFRVNINQYKADKGSRVSFSFSMEGSEEEQAAQTMVRNPINVSYNALKLSKEEDPLNVGSKKIGEVNYVKTELVKDDETGKVTDRKYYFSLKPDEENGYTIAASDDDGETSDTKVLYATYTTGAKKEATVALHKDSGSNYWYIQESDMEELPAGALITVHAVFSEDKHEIQKTALSEDGRKKEYDAEEKNGDLTFNKSSAKATDVITITTKPADNYVAKKVIVSYKNEEDGETVNKTLTPDEEGKVNFAIPSELASGAKLYVDAEFVTRNIELQKSSTSNTDDVEYPDPERKYVAGESLALSLNEDAEKAGKKISSVKVSYTSENGQTKEQTLSYKDGKVTIPKDAKDTEPVVLTVQTALKAIELPSASAELEHGKLTFTSARADQGESVTVKVEPEAGYRLKSGSGKAGITVGSKTWQVKFRRKDDNTYTFVLPQGISEEEINQGKVSISLSGTFEKGWADSTQVDTSVGASLAVNVVLTDNKANIKGGDLTAKGVTVAAGSTDNTATTAKAGYSKGLTGVAGGIAVQVADYDTQALIRKGGSNAAITTDSLDVSATGTYQFAVTGDAAGKIEAGNTGVGSGIAVAVNGADAKAGIEDGVKVNYLDEKSKTLTAVKVDSKAKVTDKVEAKAGSAGGKSVTPVAAVDVISSSAVSYLGKIAVGKDAEQALQVNATDVTASNTATHKVSADASSTGQSVSLGGAFAVSVISNKALAELNKSIVSTGTLNVTASSKTTANITSKAGASGGAKGSSEQDGSKGGADQKTDSLLGGVGKLAGKTGKSGMMKDASNRQQAQTSEGSVSAAAGMVVNVLKNSSVARIADGVHIRDNQKTPTLKVNVTSTNRTEAGIKADASATKSDIGVGIGVAVNVVTIENKAYSGNGKMRAGSLTVSALMPEATVKPSTIDKVEPQNVMEQQIADAVSDAVNSLTKSMGLSQSVVGSIAGTFAGTFTTYILNKTGLQELLGTGSFQQRVAKARALLNQKLEDLAKLPLTVAEPMLTAFEQLSDTAGMTAEQWKQIVNTAIGEIKVGLPSMLSDTAGKVVGKVKNSIISNLLGLINTKLTGETETKKEIVKKLKETVKTAAKTELSLLIDTVVEDSLSKLTASVPVLTKENIDLVRKAVKEDFDQQSEKMANDLVDAFKEQVFDYEKALEAVQNTDFKSEAVTMLKNALIEAGVEAGNTAISSALSGVRLEYSPEDTSDKHVISTQAISGVGAKDVGVAGSVAITVLNSDTKAEVASASGSDTLSLYTARGLNIEAQDTRRVKNVASAAQDEFGDANENEDAAAKEQADAGSGDSADKVLNLSSSRKVTAKPGANLARDEKDPCIVWITLDEGYKLPVGSKVSFTFKKDDGKEAVGYLTVKGKEENGTTKLYIDLRDNTVTAFNETEAPTAAVEQKTPAVSNAGTNDESGDPAPAVSPTQAPKDSDPAPAVSPTQTPKDSDPAPVVTTTPSPTPMPLEGLTINVVIEPEEDLHDIFADKIVTVYTDEKGKTDTDKVDKKAVSVTVANRDQEIKDGKLQAKAGDEVLITLDRTKTPKLAVLEVTYMDNDGKDGHLVLNQKSSGENEVVYVFTMPDGNVDSIQLQFADDPDGESKKETKDENGNSVGVGASFSMIYGNADVTAIIGEREINSAYLYMNAVSDHKEDVNAVAGTDPLAGTADSEDNPTKDFALDAAVALNILDNSVKVEKGPNEAEDKIDRNDGKLVLETGIPITDKTEDMKLNFGDVQMTASENSITDTHASGFAVGNFTAVGAAVAVNLSTTDLDVNLYNGTYAEGSIRISADSHSEDNTKAFATAVGADIQRNLNKMNKKLEEGTDTANKVLDGSYFNEKKEEDDKNKNADNSNNKTASMINNRLNEKNSTKEEGKKGDEAGNSMSLSTNVLRNQNVTADTGSGTKDAKDEAGKEIKEATGQDITGQKTEDEDSKFQVAAAVGVTVASHKAKVKVNNYVFAEKDISITSDNTGNFSTLGTGAAMSLAKNANSIAAGVAVSVNENTAKVDIAKNLVAKEGDLTLAANLTQNMDGDYRGKLAAQALAGSVSGEDSKASIAGAVAVVVSSAESTVDIASGTGKENTDTTEIRGIRGKKVSITAADKSKLAVRAGGVSVSKGSKVGMGLSAAAIKSNNTVRASIGDYAHITANELELSAKKLGVSYDDYESQVSFQDLITDSSDLSEEERSQAETGLIDLHKGEDDKSYSINVNMNSEDLLKGFDALNFLSSQNYYAEAVSGSVMTGGTGKSKLSAAGSFAVVDFGNDVRASLGDHALVVLSQDDQHTGSMNIDASSDSNARIIAGALSVAPSKYSGGLTVAYLGDEDKVTASTGADADISVSGDFSQKAKADADTQLFTIAAAAGTSSGSKAMGGAVNVVVAKNEAQSTMGNGSRVSATNNVKIGTDTQMDLTLVSVSANGAGGTAAGGTVDVIVNSASSQTKLGDNVSLDAGKDAILTAMMKEDLISGIASASATVGGSGSAVAGTLSTLITRSKANVDGGENLKIKAGRDVRFLADSDSRLVNAMLSASGSTGGAAVGAAVGVNVYRREAQVRLKGSETLADQPDIQAERDVISRANAKDTTVTAGLAAAAGTGTGVSGNIQVTVGKSQVNNTIDGATRVKAGGNAVFSSGLKDFFVDAAGSIAVSGGSAGVGAAAVTVVKNNTVTTDLGRSYVHADGLTPATKIQGLNVKGIFVGAYAKATQFIAAAGVGVGSGSGITGVVVTDVSSNTVKAITTDAVLDAYQEGSGKDSEVRVKAKDDTKQTLLAGGLNAGATAGVGASVVTLVSGKTVEALSGVAKATKNVDVTAENEDKVTMVAVSAGGAGTAAVEVGAAVQVLKSKVNATLAKEAHAGTGSVTVFANNYTKLVNAAVTAAGAGAAAVTPTAAVTYFKGESKALLENGTKVDFDASESNQGRALNIRAASTKDIDIYSIGAAAGGTAGVSGTANILVAGDTTSAVSGQGTDVTMPGEIDMNVTADGRYKVRSASAAIGVGGVAGVAVNAVVSVLKDTALAQQNGKTDTKGKVNVSANAARDVISQGLTLAGGGVAGVGVTVLVLAAGSKMTDDAANMLAYGNSGSDEGDDEKDTVRADKTFDADTFLKQASAQGADTSDLDSLKDDISGNGQKDSENSVGSEKQKDEDGKAVYGFDADSGYRSNDFSNNSYKDEGEKQRGEDMKASESSDVTKAKSLGTYTYKDTYKDAVTAEITKTADITAGSVDVLASQPTKADLFGANVAVGGVAGVGVSTAVAVLHSNVFASSAGKLNVERDVNIKASSTSEDVDASSNQDEQKRMDALTQGENGLGKDLTTKLNPTQRSIRAIALTASGGFVGVGVSVAVVKHDNVTKANLGGTVSHAENIHVAGEAKYDNVMAATLAASAGAVATNASVAVTTANGDLSSTIDQTADIKAFGDDKHINVSTNAKVNANAIAATAGAGLAAVNGGVAVAANRLKQNTEIFKGARIEKTGNGNITVKADSHTGSNAYLLAVGAGGVAANMSAAATITDTQVNTGVGLSGSGKGYIINKNGRLDVGNSVYSYAEPEMYSFSEGLGAVNSSVLIALNNSKAKASVAGADLTLGDLAINSDLAAKGISKITSVSGGGLAAGISVNYVDLNAQNTAELDTSDALIKITKDLSVTTGKGKNDYSYAETETRSGTVGILSVGHNSAISRNRTSNTAQITGNKELTIGGSLTLAANQTASSEANVAASSAGLGSIAASTGIALNEAKVYTRLELPAIHVGSLEMANLMKAATNSTLINGTGALLDVTANVAVAYGRSVSSMEAKVTKASKAENGLSMKNDATDLVRASVKDGNIVGAKGISATAMIAAAYGQDKFLTYLNLLGSRSNKDAFDTGNGSVDLNTDYTSRVAADVMPSLGGVSLGSVDVNAAIAKSTVNADTILTGNTLLRAKDVNVRTQGTSTVDAKVNTPIAELSALKVNVNVVNALLKTKQQASVESSDMLQIDSTGEVNIISRLNEDVDYAAKASLGGNGGGTLSASLGKVKANYALADADASVIARSYAVSTMNDASSLNIKTIGKSTAKANVGSSGGVSGLSVGVNVVKAKASGRFQTYLSHPSSSKVKNINVVTAYQAYADALGGVSEKGIGNFSVGLLTVDVNTADATVNTDAQAYIDNEGHTRTIESLKGDVFVAVKGAVVRANAEIGSAKLAGGLNVVANKVTASQTASQTAYIADTVFQNASGRNITVKSVLSEAKEFHEPKVVQKIEDLKSEVTSLERRADKEDVRIAKMAADVDRQIAAIEQEKEKCRQELAQKVNAINSQIAAKEKEYDKTKWYNFVKLLSLKSDINDLKDERSYVNSQANLRIASLTAQQNSLRSQIDQAKAEKNRILAQKNQVLAQINKLNAWMSSNEDSLDGLGISNVMPSVNEAKVKVGGTGGASLIKAVANIGSALTNATLSSRFIRTQAGGANVNVDTLMQNTKATAEVTNEGGLELAGVGTTEISSDAAGVLTAGIEAGNTVIQAGDVNVRTSYDVASDSTVKTLGNQISGFQTKLNLADSHTRVKAASRYSAEKGELHARNINITLDGSIDSHAAAKTPEWNIGIGKISASQAKATADATQEAGISTNGSMTATGNINVLSTVRKASAHSEAGSAAKGGDIGFFSAAANKAESLEAVKSRAVITGLNTPSITAGNSLTVDTHVDGNGTVAKAATNGAGGSLNIATLGSLEAVSQTKDDFAVSVDGVSLKTEKGDITLNAKLKADSQAVGTAPGGLSGANGTFSNMTAYIGTKNGESQVSKVLVGKNATINAAGSLTMKAENLTSVKAELQPRKSPSLASGSVSLQESYTNKETEVNVGSKASLKAGNDLRLSLTDKLQATSEVESEILSLALALDKMKGFNKAVTSNKIHIGNEASLTSSQGNVDIQAISDATQTASMILEGNFSLIGNGQWVEATNGLSRESEIAFGDKVQVKAGKGISVYNRAGNEDHITTTTKADGKAVTTSVAKTRSTTDYSSLAIIRVGQGASFIANDNLKLLSEGSIGEMKTSANAYNLAVSVDPEALATANIKDYAQVLINPNTGLKVKLESSKADVVIHANSDKMQVETMADSHGGSIRGSSTAKAYNNLDIYKKIYLDNTNVTAKKNISIRAYNTDVKDRNSIKATSNTTLTANYGDMYSHAVNSGSVKNEIRSKTGEGGYNVSLNAKKKVEKKAENYNQNTTFRGNGETVWGPLSLFVKSHEKYGNAFINSKQNDLLKGKDYTKSKETTILTLHISNKDFADYTWENIKNGKFLEQIEKSFTTLGMDMYEWAKSAISTLSDWVKESYGIVADSVVVVVGKTIQVAKQVGEYIVDSAGKVWDATKGAFVKASKTVEKALKEIGGFFSSVADTILGWFRASYDEEVRASLSEIYLTEIETTLAQDAVLSPEDLSRYLIWNNAHTFRDYLILPNATRLSIGSGNKIHFVTEVMVGDLLDDGRERTLEMVTVLSTADAADPVIELAEVASLHFKDGSIRLAANADMDLFLDEVSGQWMKEGFEKGLLNAAIVDPDRINSKEESSDELEGTVISGIILEDDTQALSYLENGEGKETQKKVYWLGRTPAEAEASDGEDSPVYALVIDEETDEVKAYRTSAGMMADGTEPIDSSVLVLRDRKADRMGEVAFQVMFYDTEGANEEGRSEMSLYNRRQDGKELDTPASLTVQLRGYEVEGSDYPAYSMSDHLFILSDGSDGEVNICDGAYTATFEDDVFESDYLKIEGVSSGSPIITVKADQLIWPEFTNPAKTEAIDLNGTAYRLTDGEWVTTDAQ